MTPSDQSTTHSDSPPCPCGSQNPFENCCGPILAGQTKAASAEQLMRARYSAHVTTNIAYLMNTWAPESKGSIDPTEVKQWASESTWVSLIIHHTIKGEGQDNEGWVEFSAFYRNNRENTDKLQCHREKSYFRRENQAWLFVDGENLETKIKLGRNSLCVCGSGKKQKRCCGSD